MGDLSPRAMRSCYRHDRPRWVDSWYSAVRALALADLGGRVPRLDLGAAPADYAPHGPMPLRWGNVPNTLRPGPVR